MAIAAALPAAGCGKKGPPLAPFVRVPAPVGAVNALRVADDVYVSFAVPASNADGQKPATIGAVHVYAVTSELPPATEEQREVATLVATIPVRPILPDLPTSVNGSAPPDIPLPPGVTQGATAVVREGLTAELRVPVELPAPRGSRPRVDDAAETEAEPFVGPLVAPRPTRLPRRHYFVVSTNPRGRESAPSGVVSLPLEGGSSAPGAPSVTSDLASMTITWTPSPDARTGSFLLPPTVKPVAGANATPANITPRVPAPLPPLTAKSLVYTSEATTYHVYDATPPAATDAAAIADPFAIKVPAALTPVPVADTEFVIKGVAFGVERCFEVRPVDTIYGSVVIGPASPRTCVTPKDTFAPAAPRSLAAIAAPGVISLIWDANSEPDLAGYIVLRGEAPGDTMQAITAEPITANTFRDETVKPGTRYVYAVVAVDRAVPQNVSARSERVEETARQ